MSGITLSAPEPLAYRHDLSAFSCGEETLADWLRRRAGKNEQIGLHVTNAEVKERIGQLRQGKKVEPLILFLPLGHVSGVME